jgi:hypothetical protein
MMGWFPPVVVSQSQHLISQNFWPSRPPKEETDPMYEWGV